MSEQANQLDYATEPLPRAKPGGSWITSAVIGVAVSLLGTSILGVLLEAWLPREYNFAIKAAITPYTTLVGEILSRRELGALYQIEQYVTLTQLVGYGVLLGLASHWGSFRRWLLVTACVHTVGAFCAMLIRSL